MQGLPRLLAFSGNENPHRPNLKFLYILTLREDCAPKKRNFCQVKTFKKVQKLSSMAVKVLAN